MGKIVKTPTSTLLHCNLLTEPQAARRPATAAGRVALRGWQCWDALEGESNLAAVRAGRVKSSRCPSG